MLQSQAGLKVSSTDQETQLPVDPSTIAGMLYVLYFLFQLQIHSTRVVQKLNQYPSVSAEPNRSLPYSQAARVIKNLWWVKITVPTKTLYILNAEVVPITVWGISNLGMRGYHWLP